MLTKKRMFEIMKEAGMDVKKFDQLMQKETAQLSEEELSQIAGGFSDGTKDKYTVAEYAAAGVDFRYHRFACDAYVLNDHYITQEGAEEAVRLIKPGQRVFIGSSCGEPQCLVSAFSEASTFLTDNSRS